MRNVEEATWLRHIARYTNSQVEDSLWVFCIGIDKVVIMEITSSNNKIVPVTFQAGVDALTFDESIRVDILNG